MFTNYKLCLALSCCSVVILSMMVFTFKNILIRLYVRDEEIISMIIKTLFVTIVYYISNSAYIVIFYFYKAINRQKTFFYLCIANYYVIQTGIVYYLGKRCELGIVGIYIGMCIGQIFSVVLSTIKIFLYDYSKIKLEIDEELHLKEIHSNKINTHHSN